MCAICCMPIPSGVSAVDRTLLRDDVYRRLRDAIVDGTFLPGEQLKDGELAEWLGVSRTPVREALLRLAGSGLVVALPGRSTKVSTIDPRAVRDARDVIAAMHELAVRHTTGRLSEDDIDRMREANHRFAEAVTSGDIAAALDADEEIHRIPVAALGNHALAAVLDQFDPLVRRAERLRFSTDGHASVELHARLIDMIAAGDARAAASVAFDIWHTLAAEDGADG
ncbi:putative transcriptional regulator, GntR family protein [Asanoa ishikariensis]|uniref:DNA-binding transcriptional regulator, GntR family n=2 Tax=Asanoa ishikariensis TaxID=137265 RepID=A0A1H3SZZ6_9ACTN|nr:putative transcriptional regulator, GntR family protein [Asanoa ishikariensis]SDZ42669.1 DNA-binding transcriptional regulator, GntR family [Asanoa ishikariensis]